MLLYSKWITNKDLLHSTWNSPQCYVPAWMARGSGGGWTHVYVWLSPFVVHLKLPQHCESTIPQYKIKSLKCFFLRTYKYTFCKRHVKKSRNICREEGRRGDRDGEHVWIHG